MHLFPFWASSGTDVFPEELSRRLSYEGEIPPRQLVPTWFGRIKAANNRWAFHPVVHASVPLPPPTQDLCSPRQSLSKEGLHRRSWSSRNSDLWELCVFPVCKQDVGAALMPHCYLLWNLPVLGAAEVRPAAWRPGQLQDCPGTVTRPKEQLKASLSNSHLGTSLQGLAHPIYSRSV